MNKPPLKVVSNSSDDTARSFSPANPVVITSIGRQRVGKTVFLNTLVQLARGHGAEIDVWNADLLNKSHSLSTFHQEALVPDSNLMVDQRNWIEARFEAQVQSRRDAVLDVGGGWTAFHHLIEETPLIDVLEEANLSLVAVYVLGTEAGDIDYLDTLQSIKMFLPKKSLIVLNEGLVGSGRDPASAFEPIGNHPVVQKALNAGAKAAFMPALSCMAAVTDRGLSFADFANGKQVAGFPNTSMFDRARVRRWFERDMPAFFSKIQPGWLPRLAEGEVF